MKVVILTVYEEDEMIFGVQAGAVDYLIKNATPSEIVNAVKDAYYNRSRSVRLSRKKSAEGSEVKINEDNYLSNIRILLQLTYTEIDI